MQDRDQSVWTPHAPGVPARARRVERDASQPFDRPIRFGVAIALACLAALISAAYTPRGPATSQQALVSIAGALAVGLAIGLVMRTRWSLVLGPAVFLLAFEVARFNVRGPTVDGIALGTTYGIIAFVVGRFVHGLLVLVPMALGAAYGTWLTGGQMVRGNRGVVALKGAATALVTVAIAALALLVAQPGTTAAIVGAGAGPVAGSIAELTSVQLGGHEQALMIRGRSVDNPVLLYLAGGPGGTDLGAMRGDVGLEQDFVVVTWEQRGTGKSYVALDPAETLTVNQMVADTIELTNLLRTRFDEQRDLPCREFVGEPARRARRWPGNLTSITHSSGPARWSARG